MFRATSQPGDVLLSVRTAAPIVIGGLTVETEDIFVFRPDTAGDYSSGTFLMFLDASDTTIPDMQAFTLVEQTTTVGVGGGAITVNAGDILYATGLDANIYRFVSTSYGDTTAGVSSTLIEGADIGINANINALELIENDIAIDGVQLTAGQLLVSINADDATVGNNNISVGEVDVFMLDVTSAGVATAANATLLFDGSDVGLDQASEDVNSFAIFANHQAPSITGLASDRLDYLQNSGAQHIDQGNDAVVADIDSADFDGGNLTVSITVNGDGSEDVLSIRDEGNGAGQIGLSGGNVTYEGTLIGTAVGGTGGADLVITFNANATPLAVSALVRRVTYNNSDGADPTFGTRTIEFTLDDGDGNVSVNYDTTVAVQSHNEASAVWLSTQDPVSNSGAPGLDSWDDAEVLGIGNPDLRFGLGTTNGTFSSVFNTEDFGAPDIDAMHYVSRDMTVGTNNFQLFQGDVLVSLEAGATLTSSNSLAVAKDDIFIFRPDTPGDYSSGTFLMFFDSSLAWDDDDIQAFTLVEQDTTVGVGAGSITLLAGTLLFNDGDSDIFNITPGDLGAATTAGSWDTLINGSDIGFDGIIDAIELIERDIMVGDTLLTSGQILVSLADDDGDIGSNSTSADREDVFILDVVTVGASTVANVTPFFDGGA
ncbi:MAG: hypothetical protein JRF55_17385, partial [Deltaproteobacteria bacterium]|nr:hypothetical protein [Deltaproteobacteria bacterium]